MYSIEKNIINELEINKSKFITLLYQVNSLEEINMYINNSKKLYKDATHYCYAYILDNMIKMSDDNEPSGTAGNPILNVLKQNNLNKILCIVVRYFGGIKLGAGGLIRAYSTSAKEALNKTVIKELIPGKKIRIEVSYNNIDNLNYILKDFTITYKEFNDKVIYEVLIKDIDLPKINMYQYEILENIYITK